MLQIDVSSKKYNCHVELEHKASVIIGDSAVGKSVFAKAVVDDSGAYKVKISESFEPVLLTRRTWEALLEGCIRRKKQQIFIVDDEDFIFDIKFCEIYKQIKTSYFIFIVRTQIIEERLQRWNGISISADAIYEFIKDGKNHYTKKITRHNYDNFEADTESGEIDLCLCEDIKSGYLFFKKIFKNIVSSDGKDNILKFIMENEELFKNKVLYLVVDCAAIGFKLDNIIIYLSKLGCKVCFSIKYESFEYLVLRSKFFNIDITTIKKDILKYASLEEKCTLLLEQITKGKIYTYSKGNVPLCYLEDCCKMNRAKIICDKGMSGDKIEAMLKGTEFEYILEMRQV